MISKGSKKMCCSIAISPENSRAQTILSDTWSATWKRLLTPYCKMSVFPGIYLSVSCFLYVSLFSVQVEYFTGGIKLVLVFGSHHYYIILKKKKRRRSEKTERETCLWYGKVQNIQVNLKLVYGICEMPSFSVRKDVSKLTHFCLSSHAL